MKNPDLTKHLHRIAEELSCFFPQGYIITNMITEIKPGKVQIRIEIQNKKNPDTTYTQKAIGENVGEALRRLKKRVSTLP